jgi:hypothetical protein
MLRQVTLFPVHLKGMPAPSLALHFHLTANKSFLALRTKQSGYGMFGQEQLFANPPKGTLIMSYALSVPPMAGT